MKHTLRCNGCDLVVIHEGNGINPEAEYCYKCDGVFCPDCMDFTIDDNTCKECAKEDT